MEKAEKSDFIEMLNTVFSSTGVVVVARYTGLSVAEMTTLRKRMRAVGAGTKVVKNRLAKRALIGTAAEPLADLFKGPTLVAYSDDPIAAPKVVTDYARINDKLVVIGGAMGKTTLNAEGVKALASLPSLDELRGRLLGMIQTPATRIAAVVSAPAAQIARVLGAYASKDQAAA